MLGRGDLSAAIMGETFVNALPTIRRALRRFDVPLVASVSRGGGLRVLMVDGELLATAKELD